MRVSAGSVNDAVLAAGHEHSNFCKSAFQSRCRQSYFVDISPQYLILFCCLLGASDVHCCFETLVACHFYLWDIEWTRDTHNGSKLKIDAIVCDQDWKS